MLYQQIIESCFEEKIGAAGVKKSDFETILNETYAVVERLKDGSIPRAKALIDINSEKSDLSEIKTIAAEIKSKFKCLVILGTGGSTLNPQTLVALRKSDDFPIYFIDSVDPFTMENYFNKLNLNETAILVTSKSGKTVETIAQFIIFVSAYEKANIKNMGEHFYIISDDIENPLRKMAVQINAKVMKHKSDIGGRFSTFTNVGLLPAAIIGLDPEKFRTGAKKVADASLSDICEPAIGASLSLAFMNKGFNITVMMPYVERLSAFATWYRQIWAESLGKDGKGTTPIRALGSLDQHSQLQLYLAGPKDKFFTMIGQESKGIGQKISCNLSVDKEFGYLKNRTVGDVSSALRQATAETLVNNGCPLRLFKIKSLDEEVLGALCMHFILETIITAEILGMNAFDQPAVEEGKRFARSILEEDK